MPTRALEVRAEPPRALDVLDLAVGGASVATSMAGTVAGAVVVGVGRALEPAFLPERFRPARAVEGALRPLIRLGRFQRGRLTYEAARQLDVVVPVVAESIVGRLQLTELVRRHVDVDQIVAGVDVDAIVDRLDLQAIVARVDLDEVAARIDVEAVLDRLDLTATVVNRVDFKTLVDSVLAEVDVAGIVSQVLDEIDLPVLIRASTGTMASDTVQTVRLRGVDADEAVNRLAARLRLRRRPAPDGTARE
jgi:hypothetical protein